MPVESAPTTTPRITTPTQLPSVPAVGVLVPEFPSQTHVFFWREIVAWRAAGASVDLLSTRRPPIDACKHDFADEARTQTHYVFPPKLTDAAKQLLRWPSKTRSALAYIAGLKESSLLKKTKTLALLASAADLVMHCRDRNIRHVHCHSFANAAHVCAMAHRMGGPTYSLTLHGDLPVYGTDHRSKLSGCTAVGCDGPHLVSQLVEVGYPEEKVRPNWMGVDTDRFVPGELSRDNDTFRVITVARLNRNKGHRFALRALRGLVDEGINVHYTLVGEGGFRDEIKSEIRRLKMEQHVQLLGTMGEDDVRRELQAADVFCLPSVGLGEAGPISVMEAMACELPVVASIIGATASMIDDGVTGFLCEQEHVEQLQIAFRKLATDSDQRKTMGRAARAHAVDQFDSRRTSLRLFEHIRQHTPQTFA